MKAKILLTALLTFLLVNGKASNQLSTLIIDVAEHPTKSYVVILNRGAAIESNGDLRIRNVRNGNNRIKIFKRTYQATRRNPNAFVDRLVFNGFVQVPRNSKVFTQLHRGNLITQRVVRKRNTNRARAVRVGMRPHNFNALKQTVLNEGFDNNRLRILKVAARNNRMTSRQIHELMLLLSFDNNRLKFAKIAYQNCADKQNYFIVSNGLAFNSNRKKLLKFINSQNHTPPRRGGRR